MDAKETFIFKLKSWGKTKLSELLGSAIEDDILEYLLTIQCEKDLIEYILGVVGSDTPASQSFSAEFVRRWKQLQPSSSDSSSEEARDLPRLLSEASSEDHMTILEQEIMEPSCVSWDQSPQEDQENQDKVRSSHRRVVARQKVNFVPLMSKEGQSKMAVYLPGRHPCQCLAVKHSLVNNCVSCGRIVCSQEGSGPCLFCGAVVCTTEEEEWMTKDSRKAKKLREQFFKKHNMQDSGRPLEHLQAGGQGLDKALLHRNKLLQFDQTSASRTKVIDDESDYFSVDSDRWLSASEKEALRSKQESLRERKYGSRLRRDVTLDIAGKKVVEEDVKVDLYSEEHAITALSREKEKSKELQDTLEVQTHAGAMYHPHMVADRPQFVEPAKKDRQNGPTESRRKRGSGSRGSGTSRGLDRLQDRDLQEMRDEGACLSMHQPWASLLVHGIKKSSYFKFLKLPAVLLSKLVKVEGRVWYSTHRGRLWIAATIKAPNSTDICRIQQFYMDRADGGQYLDFPLDYPTGCLLGCVDVRDCLPQDEYKEKFTDGESESEFVFIVDNPQQLTVKLPVKGKHKIWRLDKQLHGAAKKGLKRNTH